MSKDTKIINKINKANESTLTIIKNNLEKIKKLRHSNAEVTEEEVVKYLANSNSIPFSLVYSKKNKAEKNEEKNSKLLISDGKIKGVLGVENGNYDSEESDIQNEEAEEEPKKSEENLRMPTLKEIRGLETNELSHLKEEKAELQEEPARARQIKVNSSSKGVSKSGVSASLRSSSNSVVKN